MSQKKEVAEKVTKKVQTTEERELLVAGVEFIKSNCAVTEKLGSILDLAISWRDEDAAKDAAKAANIEVFGTTEALKDYVDNQLKEDIKEFTGISKLVPIVNNIHAFYARRATSGTSSKKAMRAVVIAGETYMVSVAYFNEVASLPIEERRSLILAHEATKKTDSIEEL